MSVRDCADTFQQHRNDLLAASCTDFNQPQQWDDESGFLIPGAVATLVRQLWPEGGTIGPVDQLALRGAAQARNAGMSEVADVVNGAASALRSLGLALVDCTEDRTPVPGHLVGRLDHALGVLRSAAGEMGRSNAVSGEDLLHMLTLFGGPEAAEIARIAMDKTKTADERIRLIYSIDNTRLGWSSEQWAELVRTSAAAVRNTSWWREDKKRLSRDV